MKDRLPALVALALLVTLTILTWWAADYAQRAIAVDPPARFTHEPDAWGERIVMLRTDEGGLPVNRLEGDYMEHFPDDDSYEVREPRATGLRADNPVTLGTARQATIDQNGARVTLNGQARLTRAADGARAALVVASEQLVILTDQDVVQTSLPARVTQGASRMDGVGMRYDNRTRQLDILADADVKIAGADSHGNRGNRSSNSNRRTPRAATDPTP